MRIWIVETGEPLLIEENVRLHRNGLLAKHLIKKGHEVHFFSSTFSHLPKINFFNEDTSKVIDGVNCHYLWTKGYRRNISLERINHNKVFAKKYFNFAKKLKAPDVILSPIPVIESAVASLELKRFFGSKCKVVTDVRDEWPDVLKNVAPKPFRPLARLILNNAYRNMSKVCTEADGILGISKEQLEYGLSFAPHRSNIPRQVIYFGYDDSLEDCESEEWLTKKGINLNKKTVCFIGTLGRFFNFDTVFKVAKQMPEVQFLMAGKGDLEEELLAKTKDIKNVFWLGWVNQPKIQLLLKVSALGLAPYKKGPFSLSNKPIEYMSRGLPVVHSIEGELKTFTATYKCGSYYEDGDDDALHKALQYYLSNPTVLTAASDSAQQCFNENFRLSMVNDKFEIFFSRLVQKSSDDKAIN